MYAGPFPPPGQVSINLTVLQTRQLIISWSPVAPDCPAVHYNILASNCGSCPTTTNHTNVTCTDVPISATLCVFALRTVACEHITGMSSNPISLSLSNGSSIHENIINSGDNDNNRKVLISGKWLPYVHNSLYLSNITFVFYCFVGLIGALISAIVLFAVCVLPFMIAIIMLVRIKKRLRNQLASSKATVKYNTTSESDSKSAESDTKLDTRKNISYETNPAAVRAKKNIAYEDKPIAVDTRKNVAYEVNVVSSSFLKD